MKLFDNNPWHIVQMAIGVLAIGIAGYFMYSISSASQASTASLTVEEQEIVSGYIERLWQEEEEDAYAQKIRAINEAYNEKVDAILASDVTPELDEDVLDYANRFEIARFAREVLRSTGDDEASEATWTKLGFTTDSEMIAALTEALALDTEAAAGDLMEAASSSDLIEPAELSSSEKDEIRNLAQNLADAQDWPELADEINVWLDGDTANAKKTWWQIIAEWFKRWFGVAHAQYMSAPPAGVNWTWDKPEQILDQEQEILDELAWLYHRLDLNTEALRKAETENRKASAAMYRKAIELIGEKIRDALTRLKAIRDRAKAIRAAQEVRDQQEQAVQAEARQVRSHALKLGSQAYERAKEILGGGDNSRPEYDDWLTAFKAAVEEQARDWREPSTGLDIPEGEILPAYPPEGGVDLNFPSVDIPNVPITDIDIDWPGVEIESPVDNFEATPLPASPPETTNNLSESPGTLYYIWGLDK